MKGSEMEGDAAQCGGKGGIEPPTRGFSIGTSVCRVLLINHL
jgi:hypothetical protein